MTYSMRTLMETAATAGQLAEFENELLNCVKDGMSGEEIAAILNAGGVECRLASREEMIEIKTRIESEQDKRMVAEAGSHADQRKIARVLPLAGFGLIAAGGYTAGTAVLPMVGVGMSAVLGAIIGGLMVGFALIFLGTIAVGTGIHILRTRRG